MPQVVTDHIFPPGTSIEIYWCTGCDKVPQAVGPNKFDPFIPDDLEFISPPGGLICLECKWKVLRLNIKLQEYWRVYYGFQERPWAAPEPEMHVEVQMNSGGFERVVYRGSKVIERSYM